MPDNATINPGVAAGAPDDAAAAAVSIPGHVDPSTGNIETSADVHVAGNVVDLHSVVAGGSVTVDGVIEAATVTAGRDLSCAGGIAGKQTALVTAAGNVSARYIRQAHVEARGNVSVQTEITNGRVVCGNDLRADGDLVGGHLTVAGSCSCKSAGTAAGTPTLIELATDEVLRRLANELIPQINRARDKAARIRTTVNPLMRNPKLLTPQQKEQATEMLFEADTAEEFAAQSLARLTTLYSRSIARPAATFVIREALHAGVTLRIGAYETQVKTTLPGPLGIRLKSSPGHHSFQVVNCCDKSSFMLPASPVQDPVMTQLRKEMSQRV